MFADTESSRKKFTRISCSDIYKENTIKNKCVKLWGKWQCKLQHNRALLLQPREHKTGGTTFGRSNQGPGKLDLKGSHQGRITRPLVFPEGLHLKEDLQCDSVWQFFQCLTMFSVENFFLTSDLSLPWCNLGPFKPVNYLNLVCLLKMQQNWPPVERLLNAVSLVAFLGFFQFSTLSWFCKCMAKAINPGNG